jgi:hypothetical protein
MKTTPSTTVHATVAATVAPEDLRCGDYVAILHEVVQLPSFFWRDALALEPHEMVKMRCIPEGNGTPLKVEGLCLPFVFVKSPLRQWKTIDVRQVQLVRLRNKYAKKVWATLQGQKAGCHEHAAEG